MGLQSEYCEVIGFVRFMTPLAEWVWADLLIVGGAGALTGLATGLGVLPFFVTRTVSLRWMVGLWGTAIGLMVMMSGVVVFEGLESGSVYEVALGAALGAGLMGAADRLLQNKPVPSAVFNTRQYRLIVLVVGAMFIHSIPEGVAVGVAFAELPYTADVSFGGLELPMLAVSMTIAMAVLNIPEGLAIALPLITHGVSRTKALGWAVLSGVPQPIGAVGAYLFVSVAEELLPVGLGFAAGALVYLMIFEFLPTARKQGRPLPNRGQRELLIGIGIGALLVGGLLWATH